MRKNNFVDHSKPGTELGAIFSHLPLMPFGAFLDANIISTQDANIISTLGPSGETGFVFNKNGKEKI